MISRSNIDDAVEGYIGDTLALTLHGEEGTPLSEDFGPGDIPKAALISMRRDVEAFLKRNERLIRSSTYLNRRYGTEDGALLDAIGWIGVGSDFSSVRNRDSVRFDDLGWQPDELAEKLDEAAWAFPKTELYVGDPERGRGEEPGRLYFWTEKKR
jgi:hypothetical protein